MTTSLSETLSPELLGDVEALVLEARQVAHGALAGIHRSIRHGASIEFSEHKLYAPGDDLRHLDWKVFAKTDRYHIKQFEDETNLTLELLVDHSGSMGFSSSLSSNKWLYSRTLVAALAYIALRQGDAVGLISFSDTAEAPLASRAVGTHLWDIMNHLVLLKPMGTTQVASALNYIARVAKRRTMTVILSDLFDISPTMWESFRNIVAKRHDVAVLHILDPAEIEFPFRDPATFVCLETQTRLFVLPRLLRARYVREMEIFLQQTEKQMTRMGIDYHRIMTNESPSMVLAKFLYHRDQRG